jgi:hypothetical protein
MHTNFYYEVVLVSVKFVFVLMNAFKNLNTC